MGVTGLWKLIESSGKPVPLEMLENKILAIDISIWLHQVIKGFQDAKGGTLPNAHLLGLFHRLCKLLFYKIKPIFVFDGGIPALKRQTMAKRAESKNKLLNEADRLQSLLLSTLAKEKVVQQALGSTAVDILAKSPIKAIKGKQDTDDMFKLPPINDTDLLTRPGTSKDNEENKSATQLTLHSIDVDSTNFKTLPADVRHDILTDMKETRKQNSWGRLHELPAHSDQFSTFQMQRLLKRRKVQVCLEDAEKEMGGQSLSVRDLESLLTEEGIVAAAESNAKRIHADDNTRFLMVSSIKEAMQKAIQKEDNDNKGGGELKTKSAELGPEFDDDLKRAVKMSRNDSATTEEEDNDNEGQEIFMSSKQRSNLTEAAKEMARAYMMEYAGMSAEDVQAILGGEENTASDVNDTLMELMEQNELEKAIEASLRVEKEKSDEKQNFSDSDSEIDFEEVKEEVMTKKTVLEIVVDPDKVIEEEEDLFADVFKADTGQEEESDQLLTVVQEITDSSEEEEEISATNRGSPVETNATVQSNISSSSNGNEITNETIIELDSDEEHRSPADSEMESHTSLDENGLITKSPKDQNISTLTATTEINLNWEDTKNPPAIDVKSLLESLEKQKASITSITLDDLKAAPEGGEDPSIIEIPSDDDDEGGEISPSKKRVFLTDYFQTTPNKSPKVTAPVRTEEKEVVPFVKSPFFVKKTPRKSSEKKTQLASSAPVSNKATKTLFNESPAKATEVRTEDLIKEASDLLRSQKSSTELKGIAQELRQQNSELEQERNKQNRFGSSITERMSRECQELLRLFGIPFIVAPMEAEAQCAFLNEAEITQGTITDDSDVWLFGGATVYKNFFDQRKHVLQFKMETIQQLFQMDRKKFIQLAMLVGSDYTTGITGIGAVTGMEILAQFPCTAEVPGETTEFQSMMSGLRRFKEWWQQGGSKSMSGRGVLRSKLKNISIGEGFPSRAVIEAYLHPRVDDNREQFSWGTPDAETIREFAKKNFGWTKTRTDELLVPVMKKLEERSVQRSIKNYFNCASPAKLTGLKVSKRVANAVRRMMDPNGEEHEPLDGKGKRRKKEVKETKKPDEIAVDSDCQIMEESGGGSGLAAEKKPKQMLRKRKTGTAEDQPGTSSSASSSKRNRVARIPETKEVFPQRDRMRVAAEESKRKAAEIFQKKKNEKD